MKKITGILLAICVLLAFVAPAVQADYTSNPEITVTGDPGSRVIQIGRTLGYGDTLRPQIAEAYASLEAGDRICYFDNCIVSEKQADGSVSSEVWETAGIEDIRTAMLNLQPGDELVLHEGTYDRFPNAVFSGTAEKPIKVRGFGGEEDRPVIAYGGSDYNLFEVAGCYIDISYLTFDGEGTGKGVVRLDGTDQGNGRRLVKGVSITNCVFRAIDAVSIACNRSDVDFEDIRISGNDFLDMRYTVLYLGQHEGESTGKRLEITDNFLDCTKINNASIVGYGMELKLNVTDSVISRNLVLNPQGPGIMVYGAPEAAGTQNEISNNLVIGSRNDAGIVVGGGPATVQNNLAFRNGTYGVFAQNYNNRNLIKNVTVQNNQSGLNKSASKADYTDDQITDAASCLVANNSYHATLSTAATKAIDRIAAAVVRPTTFDSFFCVLSETTLPVSEENLTILLETLANGTPKPYDPGADLITTGDNKAGFYRFPKAITADENGIATLNFKVTPETGETANSGLRLFLAFFDSDTTAGAGDVENGKVPMQIEFRRSGTNPLNIRMYHSSGSVSDTSYNWVYGQTYEFTLELNVTEQTYRVSIDGVVLGSGFKPMYQAGTASYGTVSEIGAFGFQQWNGTGTSYADIGDIPWVDRTPPPTDYGDNVIDVAKGDAVIRKLAEPILPDAENELRFTFRISPQTMTDEKFNFNMYLFGDDVNVTMDDLANETHMPFGVNLKHQNNNTFRILNLAGNESMINGVNWSLDKAYDMEIVVDVTNQTYELIVHDGATGDILGRSGDKSFFMQWSTGEPDYETPVTAISTIGFIQPNGSSKVGNLPAEAVPVKTDISGDGVSNLADLSCLLYRFNAEGNEIPAGYDLVEDGIIDIGDILLLISLLRAETPSLFPA